VPTASITPSKPKRNTTWPSSQAAFTAPTSFSGSWGAVMPAHPESGRCGIGHSSPNLTTISSQEALTRLDETARGHAARVDA
jgi:hypothetical protein